MTELSWVTLETPKKKTFSTLSSGGTDKKIEAAVEKMQVFQIVLIINRLLREKRRTFPKLSSSKSVLDYAIIYSKLGDFLTILLKAKLLVIAKESLYG